MNGLLTILLLGFVAYMLFSRKGGMTFCGGHHDHNASFPHGGDPAVDKNASPHAEEAIIDLKKEDYKVISPDSKQAGTGTL
jgi:hypothetical protein